MSITLTSMLARPFTFTSAGAGVAGDGRIRATGGTWRDVQLTSGTYRQCLAPTSGSVQDFLRHVAASLTTDLVPDGITITVTMSTAGHVVLAASAAIDLELSAVISRLLGNAFASQANVTSVTGLYHPQHAVFTGSFTGPEKEMQRAGGWDTTDAGRVYGFAAAPASWRWPVRFGWLPRTPTDATTAATDVSPVYPDIADLDNLGDTTISRDWTWLDVVHDEGGNAGATPCALAQGTYQSIRSSTAVRYWLCQIAPESLASPKVTPQDPAWPVWHHLDLTLVLPSTSASGDRA